MSTAPKPTPTATTDMFFSETLAMHHGRPIKVTYSDPEPLGGLGYTVAPHLPERRDDR